MGAVHAFRAIQDEEPPPYDAAPPSRAPHLTMVHDDVLDTIGETLGAAALAVYVVLERRANRAGVCDPSYDTIAAALKLSRRHVIDQVKRLKEAGYVRVEQRLRSDHGNLSNVFILPRHPNIEPGAYSAPPHANKGTKVVHQMHPLSEDPSAQDAPGGERPSEDPSAQDAPGGERPSEDPSAPHAPKVNTSSHQVDTPPTVAGQLPERPETTSVPFQLLWAIFHEQGRNVYDLSGPERSKQCKACERVMKAGLTEEQVRGIVRWLDWMSGVDAFDVDRHVPKWRAAGMPMQPQPKPAAEKPLPYNHPKNRKVFVG